MIAEHGFWKCSDITSITIPDSVTTIGDWAFAYSSKLTSVTIGNSVTTIGDCAFAYSSKLTSVTIGNSVTTIGDGAFEYCEGLTSITIPNSVTIIDSYAFYYCTSLTSVTIGDSVTTIGNDAFQSCTCLTGVTIPNSVTTIGTCAFERCSKLASVIFENPTDWYQFGVGEIAETVLSTPSSAAEHLKNYGSQMMTRGAVLGYLDFIDVTDELGIEGYAVYCTNPDEATIIDIPESYNGLPVVVIYYAGFISCDNLTSITIPDSVLVIMDGAFAGCDSLTSIEIGAGVLNLPPYAFEGCHALETIIVDENNTVYDSRDNCNAIIETETNKIVFGCKNMVIPDSVTTIGEEAFYSRGLTEITIPDSVTTLENNAFAENSFTTIRIPESVTYMSAAFEWCTELTNVIFENPFGWTIDGEEISATDLSNPETAALYLTSDDYYAWAEWSCTPPPPPTPTDNTDVSFSGVNSIIPMTLKNTSTNLGYSVVNASVVYNNATIKRLGTYELTTTASVTITLTYTNDETETITESVNGVYTFTIDEYVKSVTIKAN